MVGRDNEQTQLGVTQYFKLALDHYNFKGQWDRQTDDA